MSLPAANRRSAATFDAANAHLFYGRDGEVDELLSRLRTEARLPEALYT